MTASTVVARNPLSTTRPRAALRIRSRVNVPSRGTKVLFQTVWSDTNGRTRPNGLEQRKDTSMVQRLLTDGGLETDLIFNRGRRPPRVRGVPARRHRRGPEPAAQLLRRLRRGRCAGAGTGAARDAHVAGEPGPRHGARVRRGGARRRQPALRRDADPLAQSTTTSCSGGRSAGSSAPAATAIWPLAASTRRCRRLPPSSAGGVRCRGRRPGHCAHPDRCRRRHRHRPGRGRGRPPCRHRVHRGDRRAAARRHHAGSGDRGGGRRGRAAYF